MGTIEMWVDIYIIYYILKLSPGVLKIGLVTPLACRHLDYYTPIYKHDLNKYFCNQKKYFSSLRKKY